MKIELKKVEYSERMSEETPCFCADVYADGVKLGYARNDGRGGETELHGDFDALHAYAKTLPPANISLGEYSFDHEQDVEDLVDDALHRHLHRKDMKRKMKKRTLLVKGGKLYSMALDGKLLGREGFTVLNTLPEEEALDLYIKYGTTAL